MFSTRSRILFIISIFITQFILSSCDAARTTRTSSNGSTSSSIYNYDDSSSSGSLLNGSSRYDDDDEDDDDISASLSIPDGASHCDWSDDDTDNFQMGGAHFADDEITATSGAYTLCQHESSDTTVYFQIKNPIGDEQICLIPTYHSGSNSTYLGEPRCFYASRSDKIYTVTLYKNRTGFSNYAVTGVMMMRDKSYFYTSPYPTNYKIFSVDAYLYCANYLAAYGSDAYCTAFAAAGHYVYHQF